MNIQQLKDKHIQSIDLLGKIQTLELERSTVSMRIGRDAYNTIDLFRSKEEDEVHLSYLDNRITRATEAYHELNQVKNTIKNVVRS